MMEDYQKLIAIQIVIDFDFGDAQTSQVFAYKYKIITWIMNGHFSIINEVKQNLEKEFKNSGAEREESILFKQ